MFATIKSLIPEPRQADQPRHYVGRHRQPETVSARAAVPVVPSDNAAEPASVTFLPPPASAPISPAPSGASDESLPKAV